MINPFIGYTTPVEGSRLVGRSEKIDEIQECLLAGASCSLSGLRRIGKTSVAKQVKKNIELSNPRIKTCYIALNTITSESYFYKSLVKKLFSSKDKKVIPKDILGDDDDSYLMYLGLCEYLQDEASANNFNGIVVVDELDSIVKQIPDANVFIGRIRELINSHSDYHLAFLFVSAKSLQWLQDKTADVSTLSGICRPFSLKPFDKNTGLAELLKRANIESPDFLDALFNITGGHPYLASALLCNYFDNKKDGTPDSDFLNKVRLQDECARVFLDYYNNLQEFFSDWKDEKIWEPLCNAIVEPNLEDLTDNAQLSLENLSENAKILLQNYGIIRDEKFCFSDDFLKYLKLLRQQFPTWSKICNFEIDMRQFIKGVLQRQLGVNWIDNIRRQGFDNMFNDLEERMQKEQRRFNIGNADDILDYSYLGELKIIIDNKWSWFQSHLGITKLRFTELMDRICRVRNPLAHNRSVNDSDRILAERACSEIEEYISQSNTRNI